MTSLTAKMVNYQLFYYHGQFQFTWHWELNVVRLGPTNVEISLTSHHEQLPVDIKDIYYIQENSQTKIIQFNYVKTYSLRSAMAACMAPMSSCEERNCQLMVTILHSDWKPASSLSFSSSSFASSFSLPSLELAA